MLSTIPEWRQIAFYAIVAALILSLLFRAPYVGRALRGLVSFGALAAGLFLLLQQAPYLPWVTPLLERTGLDTQKIVGDEVQIDMAPDGLFWARVTLNGYEARMLVDSGATLTALSPETARRAGVVPASGAPPIFARTANGVVQARTASVADVVIGGATASNLKVAISPALHGVDILGMNFLGRLESWRVEGRRLILTPRESPSS